MNEAKKQLFEDLDRAFKKYGYEAGLSNPGFHPHYSEVKGCDNVRPTWYTTYKIGDYELYTMYDTITDLCLSTVFDNNGSPIKSLNHTLYPHNAEDAESILNSLLLLTHNDNI